MTNQNAGAFRKIYGRTPSHRDQSVAPSRPVDFQRIQYLWLRRVGSDAGVHGRVMQADALLDTQIAQARIGHQERPAYAVRREQVRHDIRDAEPEIHIGQIGNRGLNHRRSNRLSTGPGIQSAWIPRSRRITCAQLYPGRPVMLPPG